MSIKFIQKEKVLSTKKQNFMINQESRIWASINLWRLNGGCKLLPLTLDLMVKYPWQETNFWLMIYECHSMLSCSVTSDSAAPWTVACQAPLFMGILQARMLEWVAMPFSRRSFRPRNWTGVLSSALQVDSLPAEQPGKPKNTGVGSLSRLQGIFPTRVSNLGLLHCRRILYQLSYQGNSMIYELLLLLLLLSRFSRVRLCVTP